MYSSFSWTIKPAISHRKKARKKRYTRIVCMYVANLPFFLSYERVTLDHNTSAEQLIVFSKVFMEVVNYMNDYC